MILAKDTGASRMTLQKVEHFANRVGVSEGCWEWLGRKSKSGYGEYSLFGRTCRSHRIMWELVGNPVDLAKVIDHMCENRGCCNPKHLQQITNVANVLKGQGLPAINARKTTCKRGHPFDDQNTYHKPKQRVCKACSAIAKHIYYKKTYVNQQRVITNLCRRGHELTEDNCCYFVSNKETGRVHRQCKTCSIAAHKVRYYKLKQATNPEKCDYCGGTGGHKAAYCPNAKPEKEG